MGTPSTSWPSGIAAFRTRPTSGSRNKHRSTKHARLNTVFNIVEYGWTDGQIGRWKRESRDRERQIERERERRLRGRSATAAARPPCGFGASAPPARGFISPLPPAPRGRGGGGCARRDPPPRGHSTPPDTTTPPVGCMASACSCVDCCIRIRF